MVPRAAVTLALVLDPLRDNEDHDWPGYRLFSEKNTDMPHQITLDPNHGYVNTHNMKH